MQTRRIGIGAGALNPYTRHAVAVAMTMAALDDLAPRRCVLALGSGLPLRLAQMGIAYEDTVAKVSEAIDQIRTLWWGERLVLNDRVPPVAAGSPVAGIAASTATQLATGPATGRVAPTGAEEAESLLPHMSRRVGAWWEIVRPFSFTASLLPVSVGGAIAQQGRMHWPLFIAALLGGLGLHLGTNVINEIYDVRHGIDSITSPRMSRAILKGRITEREAFVVAWVGFLASGLLGLYLIGNRGWPILLLGIVGFLGGYFYTAPPFQYKYRALGLPLVFTLMGPVMVIGAYYAHLRGRPPHTAGAPSAPLTGSGCAGDTAGRRQDPHGGELGRSRCDQAGHQRVLCHRVPRGRPHRRGTGRSQRRLRLADGQ